MIAARVRDWLPFMLGAGTVVREAPRLVLIERSRPTAAHSGDLVVFFVTLAIGIAAIAWIVRTVRSATAT